MRKYLLTQIIVDEKLRLKTELAIAIYDFWFHRRLLLANRSAVVRLQFEIVVQQVCFVREVMPEICESKIVFVLYCVTRRVTNYLKLILKVLTRANYNFNWMLPNLIVRCLLVCLPIWSLPIFYPIPNAIANFHFDSIINYR